MKLHTSIDIFKDTIRAASEYLNINEAFIEKDYWITLVLSRLALSKYAADTVFKGGTSLSKGFGLIDRFSEDVDIAIIDENKSSNEIKTLIRAVEKKMTNDLNEVEVNGITSKGSKFRKSVFEYGSIIPQNKSNRLIVEINSFSNPYPFQSHYLTSFIYDFLRQTSNDNNIEQYDLQPFAINVLNKEQTLMEKLVSLIRTSFEENPSESISKKIRHFYDLYFLMNDKECSIFLDSEDFKHQFKAILDHDQELFDDPAGWNVKSIGDSPLVKDFKPLWVKLKSIYKTELSDLAYTAIPDEKKVADHFQELIKRLQ